MTNIRGPVTIEIPYTPVLPGYFYIDANFLYEDEQHFTSIADFQAVLASGVVTYDPTHPIRVYPGLNIDNTLLDWSPLGNLYTLASGGMYIHPFNS